MSYVGAVRTCAAETESHSVAFGIDLQRPATLHNQVMQERFDGFANRITPGFKGSFHGKICARKKRRQTFLVQVSPLIRCALMQAGLAHRKRPSPKGDRHRLQLRIGAMPKPRPTKREVKFSEAMERAAKAGNSDKRVARSLVQNWPERERDKPASPRKARRAH